MDEVRHPLSGPQRAVHLLAGEHDIEAKVAGDGAIELVGYVPTHAEPMLFLAVGLTDEPGPAVARGVTEKGIQIVACWRAPYLAVERRGQHPWGRLYRLPEKLTPLNYAGLDTQPPQPTGTWMAGQKPPSAAVELLQIVPATRPAANRLPEPAS